MKRRHPETGASEKAGAKQAKISDLFKSLGKKENERVEANAMKNECIRNKLASTTGAFTVDKVHGSWLACFEQECSQPYFKELRAFLDSELAKGAKIFPEPRNVFSWATHVPVDQIRVIILGQDPYHDDGQAHGLAFSVQKGVKPPPSLCNIWKELADDLGISRPAHGCLEGWAKQGVLLLNTSLTVRAHQAASHSGHGWESFTDAVVKFVSFQTKNSVFLLWGGHAQKRAAKICGKNDHLMLQSVHPSPLSAHRGFFGCKHFSRANAFLKEHGRDPVDWSRFD